MNIKFHDHLSSGSPVAPCGQTDMTKLTVTFHRFPHTLKNNMLYCYWFKLDFSICHWEGLSRSEELKFNGTYQLIVSTDDILLVNNIHATKKNTTALLITPKVVHIEANNKRTEKILVYHFYNAEQSQNTAGNKPFENVAISNITEHHYQIRTACIKILAAVKLGECPLPFEAKPFVLLFAM